MTGAGAMAAYGQAYNMASTTGGYGYGFYRVYTVAPANTQIAVKPDGAFAYVLNSQSNDVTVVNTASATVVDKIAGGGRLLQPLTGGGVVAVLGRHSLHRIDTTTQEALPEIPFQTNLWAVRIAPDGKNALALVDGSVFVLNGATGEVRAKLEGFKHPRKAIFAQEQTQEDEGSEEEPQPDDTGATE
jgi:YVTN family beta-propeller protein